MTALDLLLTSPWPYLATAALAALTGWYVWTQPRHPGTRYFGWLTSVWMVWALAATLYTLVPSIPARFALWGVQSVFSLLEVPLQLMIVLEYTGHEQWLARRGLLLLFFPALLFAAMLVIQPDTMGYVEYHGSNPVILGDSRVKWSNYGYDIVIVLITLWMLFACLLRAPAFRIPALLLILGRSLPFIGFAMLKPQQLPVPPIQVNVLFLGFTMLLYFVALYRFRLLRVSPVARDTVIARMPYAMIVLDAEDRLVDFNPAAQNLPELPGRISLQQAAPRVLGKWWERLSPLVRPEVISADVTVPTGDSEKIFHVTGLPLLQASGWRTGQAFLIEDVTRVRQAEQEHKHAQRAEAMLREREQLARELHDSLGQVLGYASFQVDAAAKLSRGGQGAAAAEQLDRLGGIIREAHADVREYILNLHTAPSQQQPFFTVLEQYLKGFTNNYGIQTHLSIGPGLGEQTISPDTRMQVFRIIQEALSHTRKHGHARCVQLTFTSEDGRVCLAVQDDGRGFALDEIGNADGQHFGLRFMQERAEQLGGSLQVQSAPGAGTRVVLVIPGKREGRTG